MRGFGLVLAGPDVPITWRLDADIDVFRKPANDLKAFGELGPVLELEDEAQLLQAIKTMHNPVVFLDQRRIDALLSRHNSEQIGELRMVMQEITRHASASVR
jgi:hypothetical protein